MSRLGTVVFAIGGTIFGAVWGYVTVGDIYGVIAGGVIAGILVAAISWAMELKKLP